MATYAVDGQQLINIADAIREKAESTDALTLDGMAEAITAIEAGGGSAKVAYGAFTTAEALTSEYSIEHGLGVAPDFAVISLYGKYPADIPTDNQLVVAHNMSPTMADALDTAIGGGISSYGVARLVKRGTSGYQVNTYPRDNSGGNIYLFGGSSWMYINGDASNLYIEFKNSFGFKTEANTSFFWIAIALGE